MKGEKKIRIAMAVTNDLVTDRRVMRHAEALREAGCEVILIGRKELGVRAKKGWKFYVEYNVRLLWRLLRTKCEVVWANDTDTLLGSYVSSRLKGLKLVMDAHELFPEVPELVGREKVKHVWEAIERKLMPKCDAMLTVCQSIADYYRERYGVEMVVVRNVSGVTELLSDKVTERGSVRECKGVQGSAETNVLLYQGCVNKGRGVDWAIDSLEWLEDCRLVIAGGGDLLEEMKAYAGGKPWADRVEFLGRLTPEELEPLTRQASVGLVMLEDMGLSYHFALPNRIGDFVAAGVPMVVSNLPEMAVVRKFGVGEVIEGERSKVKGERCEAKALAEAVKKVLSREWREEDFAEARRDMDWNNEKQKLIEIIRKI
ncbi:MAG: glycosyltransferase family 4 protein [Bacteroidales bacterium]|nr:glycosyltransferase family 4 protein [Bacteroidales bacterium]